MTDPFFLVRSEVLKTAKISFLNFRTPTHIDFLEALKIGDHYESSVNMFEPTVNYSLTKIG